MKIGTVIKWSAIIIAILVALFIVGSILGRLQEECGDGTCQQGEKSDGSCPADCGISGGGGGGGEKPVSEGEIVLGIEYVVAGLGEGLGDLGIPAVKPLPESYAWCKMVKNPKDEINYKITDDYVKEYQGAGFTEIVFGLRTAEPKCLTFDGVKSILKNHAVKPEFEGDYQRWVGGLVERYDKDGKDDMPGLKYPVRHYEIGVEFSSYTPEPTDEYLQTLKLAYEAAHKADDNVQVGHSAFLATPIFKDDPSPDQYEQAFRENQTGTSGKTLDDIRKVLDQPELFDFVNIHNLGWPYEIERLVKWVQYETGEREYSKPIVISDTVPTSFGGFGPLNTCEVKKAIMSPPAEEEDRCRVAEYFTNLIDKDQPSIDWLRRFLAADSVQRAVIAADQNIALIDLAFSGDIEAAQIGAFRAAAGNSAWGGIVDVDFSFFSQPKVTGKRPAFYSIQQVQEYIRGYESLARAESEPDLRLYEVKKDGKVFYIAWYGYMDLYLPGDPIPKKSFKIEVPRETVNVSKMKVGPDVETNAMPVNGGVLEIELTPEPVYIFLN